MLDYEPVEIVAQADFPLSFEEAYPLTQLSEMIVTFTSSFGTHTYGYDIAATNSVLANGGEVATLVPEYVGNRIFAVILKSYDGELFSQFEVLNSVGVCYYVITNSLSSANLPIYMKLTRSDIPDDIQSPFGNSVIIDGTDIVWLYNLGDYLMRYSSSITELLNYKIGNTNLITLLFGSGFLVYVGWVIIKWAIPL